MEMWICLINLGLTLDEVYFFFFFSVVVGIDLVVF